MVLVNSGSFFMSWVFVEVILQDVEEVVWEAVGTVTFIVLLHFGEHATEDVSVDGLFTGHFLFQFPKPVQFFQIGAHNHSSLFGDDAGDTAAIVRVAGSFPHLLN